MKSKAGRKQTRPPNYVFILYTVWSECDLYTILPCRCFCDTDTDTDLMIASSWRGPQGRLCPIELPMYHSAGLLSVVNNLLMFLLTVYLKRHIFRYTKILDI
jgi:hypothetical protein